MRSPRPYRGPLDAEGARMELAGNRGSQFDPDLTTALMDLFGEVEEWQNPS